jgi:hypothetical protein
VTGFLAHGGWGGLAVEVAGGLAVVVLGLAFWIGNRREGSGEGE